MTPEEGVGELKAQIQRLEALVQTMAATLPVRVPKEFTDRVRHEKERSERYNHFFTLASFEVDNAEPAGRLFQFRDTFRKTDIVGLMKAPNGEARHLPGSEESSKSNCRIGVIMPETGREGAFTAIQRALTGAVESIKFGVAVYPDDATDPDELMKLAADGLDSAPPGGSGLL